MADGSTLTKAQLLALIDALEKSPHDKVRLMGDAGITLVGAGVGAAAATTLAAATGATSVAGLSAAASWVGLTLVGATPVGWIVGSAAATGAIAYGISRFIRGGGLAEGRKAELLQRYREEAVRVDAKERAASIDASDRTGFIISLRELIDKNAIPVTSAFRLIEQVERGRIPLSQALALIQGLLVDDEAAATPGPAGVEADNAGGAVPEPVDRGVGFADTAVSAVKGMAVKQRDMVRDAARTVGDAINTAGTTLKVKSASMMDSVASNVSSGADGVRHLFSRLVPASSTTDDDAPGAGPDAADTARLEQMARDAAPVVWMLGKTGAGKTSVIAALTDSPHADVGNGYVPCTRTAQLYDFPPQTPLIRFLDTRGLGEAGYDPADDLAWQQSQSHLVMAVMKVGDPCQEQVLDALHNIRRSRPDWPIIVVQTGLHELYPTNGADHPSDYPFGDEDPLETSTSTSVPRPLRNALTYQRDLCSGLKGAPPLFVAVDFTQPSDGFTPANYGKAALIDAVLRVAPQAVRSLVRMKLALTQAEVDGQRFRQVSACILYWAAGAGAAGVAPVVGLVTVPAAQTAMLAQLAGRYGVDWTIRDVSALLAMLGIAIVANQGALLALRQLAKLGPWAIPIAAAQDYAVTYALGRAACVYLQARRNNTEADAMQVKAAFQDGLKQAFLATGKKDL